jgi:hypothetical protein
VTERPEKPTPATAREAIADYRSCGMTLTGDWK